MTMRMPSRIAGREVEGDTGKSACATKTRFELTFSAISEAAPHKDPEFSHALSGQSVESRIN